MSWPIYVMGLAHGLGLGLAALWLSYLAAKRSIARREAAQSHPRGGQSDV